jgi:hypothetical protein
MFYMDAPFATDFRRKLTDGIFKSRWKYICHRQLVHIDDTKVSTMVLTVMSFSLMTFYKKVVMLTVIILIVIILSVIMLSVRTFIEKSI